MVQLILVPRILLLGISFIMTIVSIFVSGDFFLYSWSAVLMACILALILSVPKLFYNKQTAIAIMSLPYGFLMMVLAIFKIKLGHKRLSPTPHYTTTNVNDKKAKTNLE